MPRIRDEQKCNRRTLNAVNNLHRDSSFVPPLASRARHSYGSRARRFLSDTVSEKTKSRAACKRQHGIALLPRERTHGVNARTNVYPVTKDTFLPPVHSSIRRARPAARSVFFAPHQITTHATVCRSVLAMTIRDSHRCRGERHNRRRRSIDRTNERK